MSKFTPRRRTRAEYNAIPVKDPDIFYIVLETDETFSLYLGEEPLKTSGGGGGTVDWQDIENKPELQNKLVAGTNITINPITNVISASGGGSGDVDMDEMAYFDYAGSIYGAKYRLLASAWQDMKNSETVLFDIPLTLAAPNQEMGGMTIDLYVGTNGQLQALYDACVNETIRPPIDINSLDAYYVNNVATYYGGDISGFVGFPIPLYGFGAFNVDNKVSFMIGDLTPLSMGLGLVLAKFVNVSIPNNNIVIQQGFEFENENGIIIPDSVTSIEQNAFRQWSSNNQPLVIPDSVTSIGDGAFQNWTSNNQPLVIPNSVTNIGGAAFESWSSNNQPLTIPNSVTSIGNSAFWGWTSAKEFIMESETPPTITSSVFNNQNNAPIYVPDASLNAYKTATNWVELASRIFPMSDRFGGGGDGIPEAPIDDKLYGRKNADWSEIINGGGLSFPLEIPVIEYFQPNIYFEVPTGPVDSPPPSSTGLWVDHNRTLYYGDRKRLSDQTAWNTPVVRPNMSGTNISLMGYYDGMVVELLVSMTVKVKESNNYYQNTMLIPYELINFQSAVRSYRIDVVEPLSGNLAGYVLFSFGYNQITGMMVSYNMFNETVPDTHDCEFAVRVRSKI